MAMMKPASDVRLSPSPSRSMSSSVPPMEKSSELPMSTPARTPIRSMMSATTMASDSARLRAKAVLASRAMRSSG